MKYIDTEKLIAEIERLKSLHSPIPFGDNYEVGYSDGYQDCCDNILAFLDSLSQQPVKGLLEEVDRFWANEFKYHVNSLPTISVVQRIARHFAEWQKKQDQETIELAKDHAMLAGMNKMEQQMMEKAYDTVMQFDELDDLVPTFKDMQKFGFKVGDKVKVIILKEK